MPLLVKFPDAHKGFAGFHLKVLRRAAIHNTHISLQAIRVYISVVLLSGSRIPHPKIKIPNPCPKLQLCS